MTKIRTYRVKEVARIAGVSVRTLHHYDDIGLLAPAARSEAGYRLYDDANLLRLQQIMIQRALGLPLEDIRRAFDDPAFDLATALKSQRAALQARARTTADMIESIDAALKALSGKEPAMDMRQIFQGFDPDAYEAEVKSRWGNTDAYVESAKRTAKYGPDDWRRFAEEQAAIYGDAVVAMNAGEKPESTTAMDIAERHRLSIDRWFYPCGVTMHAGLADMYEADQRFARTIDKHGAGLTPFLAAAIRANARRRA